MVRASYGENYDEGEGEGEGDGEGVESCQFNITLLDRCRLNFSRVITSPVIWK